MAVTRQLLGWDARTATFGRAALEEDLRQKRLVMRNRTGSRRSLAIVVAVLGLCCFALAPALVAAKPPAVDEYTLDFPNAGGDNHGGNGGADPSALPSDVRRQLAAPADAPLVAIATDPKLGAVEASRGASDASSAAGKPGRGLADLENRGVFTAAAGALTDSSVLPLLLGFIAVAVLAFFARRRSPQD
jgi:hypothetical protein